MELKFFSDTVSGTCGVTVFNDFGYDYATKVKDRAEIMLGGAGWSCAGFINTELCKKYYEEFKKQLQIVYQTPVRINDNSGNEFIFVLYDGTVPVKDINNSNFEYPWSDNVNA